MLAEIAERDADGLVATIYEDIRRVFGVSFVVLVYRALATDEARLQASWEAVRPNLLSAEIDPLARALGSSGAVTVAPSAGPVLAGSTLDRGLLAQTIAAFHLVNTRNAIALTALRDGHVGGPAPRPRPLTTAGNRHPLLAMADVTSLPPDTVGVLREFSAPITGGGEPVVIPSLLRYLAPDGRLLTAVWDSLRPLILDGSFDELVAAMQDRIAASAQALPYAVAQSADQGARQLIESFLRTIPAMIVVAPLIAATLGLDIDARAHV